ncbi:PIN domain-containing protein [Mycolicibacillus parakoreensis]|uniref:PIN domain-containing protein n=1 Tax=Mycolicibacillus parakoreensis TaxID=1069221 RepID=A0ABY3U2D9_9MYCO|nr:PIN domain-containing protein [Mycolicibacillus parakoreensis]MCV7314317.1 PIN domain-containing protein [Mycolicibacillus parakoreensis]ULN53329.1 PIN domain-containing protein [Mycolicibacillus parakoreensis]
MSGFQAVLDTCVLVPIVKADLLLTLAMRQAFHPLWSEAILQELERTLVEVRPEMTQERAFGRIGDMNSAFEDALVTGWEPLESCIVGLADPDDRHVDAAAVRGNASAIVTDNIGDFPPEALESWGLHAVTSDDFLLDTLDLNASRVIGCLIEMAARRKNPPAGVGDVLVALERAGAVGFTDAVRSLLAS